MPVLTKEQLSNGYNMAPDSFLNKAVGQIQSGERDLPYRAEQVKDYKVQDELWLVCTQLSLTQREQKRIVNEWVEFLQTNTKTIKLLYFRSRVPQVLLDAACCQENLEELHIKWGGYKDLSALRKLSNAKQLKHLYIGSGAGVEDLSPLTEMKNLTSLYIVNFKKIEDYSPLAALQNLEQLIISGPILGQAPIKDYEFLRKMPNLLSVWFPNISVRKKYTSEELASLRAALPNLTFVYDSGF